MAVSAQTVFRSACRSSAAVLTISASAEWRRRSRACAARNGRGRRRRSNFLSSFRGARKRELRRAIAHLRISRFRVQEKTRVPESRGQNNNREKTHMAYEPSKYEIAEQILPIALNRPDKLNAFNGVMQQELIGAFDAA